MGDSLNIAVRDEETIENIENAISAVESELGMEVDRKRGPIRDEKIPLARAIEEMAIAYTGYDCKEDRDDRP